MNIMSRGRGGQSLKGRVQIERTPTLLLICAYRYLCALHGRVLMQLTGIAKDCRLFQLLAVHIRHTADFHAIQVPIFDTPDTSWSSGSGKRKRSTAVSYISTTKSCSYL